VTAQPARAARFPRLVAVLVVASLVAAGCSSTAAPPASLAERLREAVSAAAIGADLAALEQIADEHGGNRAVGTSGYDASVAYVQGELERAGYQVTLDRLAIPYWHEEQPGTLAIPGGRSFTPDRDFRAALFSPAGDVTAPVAAPGYERGVDPAAFAEHPTGVGCAPVDFADAPRGAILVALAGPCLRRTQVENAQIVGAGAIVIVYPQWAAGDVLRPTLIRPDGLTIPVVIATSEVGDALADVAAAGGSARVAIHTTVERREVANVIAEAAGTDPGHVLMLGGHLDSVAEGPGINDDGSGTMTILEVARRLAALGQPRWTVRFAFWAGEEIGLYGSSDYYHSLKSAERARLTAYLNFDMLGSPNGARYIYDDVGAATGSETLSSLFEQAFALDGLASARTDLSGGSDHYAFQQGGIPIGGLFSGGNEPKSELDVERFGGTVGAPLDPCYHKACDRADLVNLQLIGEMARAIGWVTGRLASGEVSLAGT
jgi:Zn-dependent M28 family amino/carboxypeptidase